MHIVRLDKPCAIRGIRLEAGTRYVLPTGHALMVEEAARREHCGAALSSFNAYERRFHAEGEWANKRVLLYRHGAFGDTLIATALVRAIKTRHPACKLYVATEAAVQSLYYGLPIEGILALPVTFDALRTFFDGHLLFEQMLECNSEPDQACAYDDMLGYAGFSQSAAEERRALEWRRPWVRELPVDSELLRQAWPEWEARGTRREARGYVVVQLQANNPNRTYPPAQLARACAVIAQQGRLDIVLVGKTRKTPERLTEAEEFLERWEDTKERETDKTRRLVNLVDRTPQFRALFPLVANARCVLAPDSAVLHLAGGIPNVPAVGLWGLFHPDDRVKYYANHHALCGFAEGRGAEGGERSGTLESTAAVCPHAPCRCHQFTLPAEKCRAAKNHEEPLRSCHALRAIGPERIAEAVLERARRGEDGDPNQGGGGGRDRG